MSQFRRSIIFSTVAQILRYGAPLAFFPHLTRFLGDIEFARFALAYSVALVAGQLIEFGFGLSGVRALAEAKSNPQAASEVVSDVLLGRGLLLAVTVIIGIISLIFFQSSLPMSTIGCLALILLSMSLGFTPSWYYIGREKAALYAGMEAAATTAQFVLIVSLIHRGSSAEIALVFLATPWLLVCLIGNVTAIADLGIANATLCRLKLSFNQSFRFFCFTSLPQIFARSNIFFLGLMSSGQQVAYYAVGERLLYAAVNMTTPVTRVLLPRTITLYRNDLKIGAAYARRMATYLGGAFAFSAIFGAAISDWIVPFVFGKTMAPGVSIIAILLLTVAPMVASRLTGMLFLVPLHQERAYQKIMILFGFFGIVAGPVAIFFADGWGLTLTRLVIESVSALILLRISVRAVRDLN